MSITSALADSIQCDNGGYSAMRILTYFVCIVVLVTWVIFCFIELRFVPITWEMVSLVGVSQGAKALQYRFEKRGEVHAESL